MKPAAERQIRKLNQPFRSRVTQAAFALGANPRPPGCLKLAGELNTWCIRVGDYRVIYEIHDDVVVLIVEVGHRREIYRAH